MASQADFKDRQFLAVIGDEVSASARPSETKPPRRPPRHRPRRQATDGESPAQDSVTGLLLAGIGHVTAGADAQKNFLVVDSKTDNATIESAFNRFTQERKDVGIVLINQHVADRIRHRIDTYTAAFPTVLEIPSKDHPYDPEKDSVLRRVRRLFGE
ncbi:ATPase, V1 complex, subunit F, eukaryotic [Drechmeria coniospora]|uniref:V-type proton ATPase subunit F n=1 Tax=Drechmeria coniospora TaxID=98403 RepID=A0A151GR56_DRECN|nr:ATPase, V1 complex, subunit F, eukaryotic [Drechmeria coniospora]KYK59548.1 ATPase, V1 complex, subunit F, eukaryotic [Drechmeria coniospora]